MKIIFLLISLFILSCQVSIDPRSCYDDFDCPMNMVCNYGSCQYVSSTFLPSGYVVQDCGCWGLPPYYLEEVNYGCYSGYDVVFTCSSYCSPGYYSWGIECE